VQEYVVLRVVAKLIIPFILLYAFYIQLHGEYSPGGGFQAGVVLAAGFILFCLIYGIEKTKKVINVEELRITACIGALLYIGVGFVNMFQGGKFLQYSTLHENLNTAQQIGIVIIELGVGITVFAAMMMIFLLFTDRKKADK
jgi:multicomponent Na+:H+ antiporter subunit B